MTKLILNFFVKNWRDRRNPTTHSRIGTVAGMTGIVCNILLFGGKLTVGLLTGAVSIVADAVNNLSDAASSVMTLLGFRLARRPADADHPYGHARYEYLSGLGVAAMILLLGAELVKSSVAKIFNPEPIEFTAVTFWVLVASMGVKFWMARFYGQLGRMICSTTLQATSIDSRNDVLATAGVLLGCLVTQAFQVHVDGFVGLMVALVILWSGIGIARETISPLLGKRADGELLDRISTLVLSHDKILGIHDLLVHDYGPGQCFASVHAELSAEEDPLECHDIIDDIECVALAELNVHLVIHYDPVLLNDGEWNEMRRMVGEIVREIHPSLSIHDFRMARGARQTKLVFDLAVPYDSQNQRKELKQKIDEALAARGKQYTTVIRFDATA